MTKKQHKTKQFGMWVAYTKAGQSVRFEVYSKFSWIQTRSIILRYITNAVWFSTAEGSRTTMHGEEQICKSRQNAVQVAKVSPGDTGAV
jgi:hypothetical protein